MAACIEVNYKYPQTIDGSHIPILPPLKGKADYICRKGYPNVVLQGVVDGHYKFCDVYANTASVAHNSTVFHRSSICDKLPNIMPRSEKIIDGELVPLHILEDPAYALSDYIIKGLIGQRLHLRKKVLTCTTPVQGCASKWLWESSKVAEEFYKRIWMLTAKHAPVIITACCIWHNICKDMKVPVPPHADQEEGNSHVFPHPDTLTFDRIDNRQGVVIRQRIKNILGAT